MKTRADTFRALLIKMRSSIFVGVASLFVALPLLYSTLAPYDDEGYVMLTIRSFSEGHQLYSDTFTQYGPAFYLTTEPLHSVLGWPLTQDAVRLKAALIWAVSCVLVLQITWRLSGSRLAAIVVALACAVHLEKLALEPGHPQEIVLLLWLVSIRLVSEKGINRWWLAGILAAIVGLTKINCGAVLALPLLIGTLAKQSNGWSRWIVVALFASSALLPLGVLTQSIRASHPPVLPIQLILSLAAIALVVRTMNPQRPAKQTRSSDSRLPFLFVLVGGLIGITGVVIWSLANGNTIGELWWGVIGQHTQFTSEFFHPIRINAETSLIAIVVLGISFASMLGWNLSQAKQRTADAESETTINLQNILPPYPWKVFATLFVWFFTIVLIAKGSASPLHHGLEPRGAATWLCLLGPALAPLLFLRRRSGSTRLALVVFACLAPIIAFPTPGTQMSIGTVPALLILGVNLGDVLVGLRLTSALPVQNGNKLRFAIQLTALASFILIPISSVSGIYRYLSNIPLDLPGARLMRLDRETAREQQAIAETIMSSGKEYLAFDGHNHDRFYFWTGLKPISATNPTFWPRLLDEKKLDFQMRQMESSNEVCVVLVPERERLAGDRAAEYRKSLVRNWLTLRHVGDWTIGVRRNEPLTEAN